MECKNCKYFPCTRPECYLDYNDSGKCEYGESVVQELLNKIEIEIQC